MHKQTHIRVAEIMCQLSVCPEQHFNYLSDRRQISEICLICRKICHMCARYTQFCVSPAEQDSDVFKSLYQRHMQRPCEQALRQAHSQNCRHALALFLNGQIQLGSIAESAFDVILHEQCADLREHVWGGHGHGHGLFILATYYEGKWTKGSKDLVLSYLMCF